jgi:hypothetical protein
VSASDLVIAAAVLSAAGWLLWRSVARSKGGCHGCTSGGCHGRKESASTPASGLVRIGTQRRLRP